MSSEIRIYVACLTAYNNGIIHGAWIEVCQDPNGIHAEISTMLKASPIKDAEEWAIHDYEGFGALTLSEYEGLERVAALAAFIKEHGMLGLAVLEYFNGDSDEAAGAISDRYAGEYQKLADFAQYMTEETTDIPQSLRYYIDYDAMARDLAINDVFAIETGFESFHVFWQQ